MDVKTSVFQYIEKVIEVADIVGIESIIIEPDRVRATSEGGEVFILHTDSIPEMPFGSIGIGRTSIFKSRYAVVKSLATKYTATTNNITLDGVPVQFARSIEMKAPKVSIDYRCANPITIKSPKKVLDPVHYEVKVDNEWVDLINKAQQAMSSDTVDFILSDEKLLFEVKDVNGDAFNYEIGTAMPIDEEVSGEFSHTYQIKMLLPILRKLSAPTVEITSLGLLKAQVGGFNVYLKPKV